MAIIISLLIISQVINFYFIFNKIKPIIQPKGILLKPIPHEITYEDVDENQSLFKDIMESIKLEDWTCEVKREHNSYDITFRSKDTINSFYVLIGGCGYSEDTPYIRRCLAMSYINPNSINRISLEPEKSKINNDIILFSWDYIIKSYEDKNNNLLEHYLDKIKSIGDKLKTLNRERALNKIL